MCSPMGLPTLSVGISLCCRYSECAAGMNRPKAVNSLLLGITLCHRYNWSAHSVCGC